MKKSDLNDCTLWLDRNQITFEEITSMPYKSRQNTDFRGKKMYGVHRAS